MNIENLNQAFIEIVEKKSTLSQLGEEFKAFSDLKKEVESLQESFDANYGRYLEEVLFNVYDEYCPDNELHSPSTYFADEYKVYRRGPETNYDVYSGAGVSVDADDFPGIKARLVLVPNPTRLVMQGQSFKEVVWSTMPVLEP